MSAAVADYTPIEISAQKIKKSTTDFELSLTKTKDILASLGSIKKNNQILVGFALETENEITNAKNKLINKNANFIVLNSMNDVGAGFNADTNKITIFDDKGNQTDFPLKSKKEIAVDIINTITHAQ
jgi:phosphopantothenoylcysteine decarboxylase/phosphopantothenate--cysteine ligase